MFRTRSFPIIGLTIFLTTFGSPLAAQGPTASADPESRPGSPSTVAAEEAQSLIERIRQTDSDLVQLIQRVSTAEGEELELLRSQIGELARQQQADLTGLIEMMDAWAQSGDDMTLLEQQGKQLLKRSSLRLRSYIELFQTALEREAVKRSDLPAGEAQMFEHRMAEESARLDRYYQGLVQLTDQMQSFGQSVEEEVAFLEQQLGERAQNLLHLLDLSKKQLTEYKEVLARSPDDGELQAQLFAAEERYEANKTSLLATLHLMKTRGMDYSDLEVRTVELTGEITPEALEVDVAVGLFAREAARVKGYLVENGPRLLLRLLVIVAILLAFWVLSRLTRAVTSRVLERTRISPSQLLRQMAISLAGRLVLLVGLIVALSQLGINLGPILAGLGIAGVVIGFALQDTLANFASGAMILAYRPFDVGDFVEAASVTGTVLDMNLVSTRILTVDNQTLIVPNSKIWGDVIRNVTAQTKRRVDMVFGISYEDDIEHAESLLADIVTGHEKVLDEPAPVVKMHTLNDSSVDFIVRPWAATEDYWDVYWDITREVKMRFDREGISIPYPQRDVRLISPTGTIDAAEETPG